MNMLPISIALLVTSSLAQAANLPALDFTCPTDIKVRAEASGPVFINDKQVTLSKFSEQYFEAKGEGVTTAISLNASGAPTVSYAGKQGANGICTKTEEVTQEEAAATEED